MNNNRQCPVCRSLLTSSNCKKCGYQEKKLKIVETQEEFGRFNYINKIQRSQSTRKITRRITPEEKLKLYLRQYIKLLKSSASKLAIAQNLSLPISQRLNDTIFQIWKGYLMRRQELGLSLAGMFKRYISSKPRTATPTVSKKKHDDDERQKEVGEKSEKDLDSNQEKKQQTIKRSANEAGNAHATSAQLKQNELQIKHKFRSYYIVTVKPLIRESIEQHKTDRHALTSCQKSFLSYLLSANEVDEDFARMCSQKYLKMLLKFKNRSTDQSYVKEGEIEYQLKLRRCGMLDKREDCVLLILLIDLLWCFDSQNFQIDANQKLTDLLTLYERGEDKSEIIDTIVEYFNKPDSPDNPTIPDITYELIYTIIALASAKIGACFTISEIISNCGQLQIGPIAIEDETYINGVANEEAINASKIRKNSHLLASLLKLQGELFVSKWSQKICHKLQLQSEVNKVTILNELLFNQLIQSQRRGENKGQFFSEGKLIKYQRHFWLEQDIACLAGIAIYLKLATGLTTYPYVINFPIKEMIQKKTIEGELMQALSQLIQNNTVKISSTSINFMKRMILPDIYQNQISLHNLSKTISSIATKDKNYQAYSFNKNFIRFRNLNHLNGMSINDIIAKFTALKDSLFQPHQSKQYQMQLKYEETLHKQFTREIADKYKKLRAKKGKAITSKPTAKLNINILQQMRCIMRENQVLGGEGEVAMTEECVVDEPSSNYELLYEYNLENLSLASRKEQLYFMEMLCLNLCNFSQLTYWLNRQESVLKFFES